LHIGHLLSRAGGVLFPHKGQHGCYHKRQFLHSVPFLCITGRVGPPLNAQRVLPVVTGSLTRPITRHSVQGMLWLATPLLHIKFDHSDWGSTLAKSRSQVGRVMTSLQTKTTGGRKSGSGHLPRIKLMTWQYQLPPSVIHGQFCLQTVSEFPSARPAPSTYSYSRYTCR
jgi:hypothetical protein